MSAEPVELFRLDIFAGVDFTTKKTAVPTTAGLPSRSVLGGSGYVLNRVYQAFATTLGRRRLLELPIPRVNGFTEFSLVTSNPRYLVAGDAGVAPQRGELFAFDTNLNVTLLTLPNHMMFPPVGGITPGLETVFAEYGQWAFLSNGVDVPLKVDKDLNVTFWGIDPPTATLAPTAVGSGPITATNPFFYAQTFANDVIESSPSNLINPVGVTVSNQNILVSNLQSSTDAQVTTINIYRNGGDSGQAGTFIFAGEVANGTATFTDTTPDGQLTGSDLVEPRDPPQKFNSIVVHKDHVFGLGYRGDAVGEPPGTSAGSDAWYSNAYEPTGFDSVNQVIPLGRNSGDDYLVGGASVGGILCCLKRKSFWAILGSSREDFSWEPLFALGCTSRAGIVVGMGQLFWPATDSIYTFAGGSYVDIGLLIKEFYTGLTDDDRAAIRGGFYDHMAVFAFPTLGITLGYDLRAQDWVQLPFSTDAIVWDDQGPAPAYLFLGSEPNSGGIDQWFTTEADVNGSPLMSSFVSGVSDCGAPQYIKQFTKALLIGSCEDTTKIAQLKVTVLADPGSLTESTDVQVINLTDNYGTWAWDLPASIQGRLLQVKIEGTSTTRMQIDRLVIYGVPGERFTPNV